MNTQIFSGDIFHHRAFPEEHSFKYPYFVMSFNVHDLVKLDVNRFLFGYNRFALLSIYDKNYLTNENTSIAAKLEDIQREHFQNKKFKSVYLITVPKLLGYVFNPVNFYICLNEDSELISAVIAEVRNTFGEKHLYYLRSVLNDGNQGKAQYEFAKDFYVSPFYDVSGKYKLYVNAFGGKLDITVELWSENRLELFTRLTGDGIAFTNKNIITTLLKYPFQTISTILKIQVQAFRLFFFKGAKIYQKPTLSHKYSFLENKSIIYVIRLLVLKIFNFVKK